MSLRRPSTGPSWTQRGLVMVLALLPVPILVLAQERSPPQKTAKLGLPTVPAAATAGTPLPINLPAALKLADARPIDILVASQRIEAATAQLERAKLLWLPTVVVGGGLLSTRRPIAGHRRQGLHYQP